MIVVKVRDRDIKAAPMGPVTTGSVGLPVSWHFSKEWEELAKTAVFRVGNDGTEITVAVLEDLCLVPDELLVQDNAGENLWIGVYGWDGEDDGEGNATIAMPTIWTYTRIQDGAQPSGIEPPEGTPGWSAQIQNATDEALRVAHGVAADADTGEFDGYSPVVTISEITHGHSVNITDREHQAEGQTFNVLDGASAYEQAVAGGYEGAEAEFNTDLAGFSEKAQTATSAAASAAQSAQNAADSASTATTKAQEAADSAAAALTRMNSANSSAQAAANSATAAGNAKTAAEAALASIPEALIQVSSTQPTEPVNKLWINDGNVDEYTVPTYSEFSELKNAIKDNGLALMPLTDWNAGYVVSTSGTTIGSPYAAGASYKYACIPCQAGDIFTINSTITGANYRPFAFTDASGTILSVASNTSYTDKMVVAVANSAYLYINVNTSSTTGECYAGKMFESNTPSYKGELSELGITELATVRDTGIYTCKATWVSSITDLPSGYSLLPYSNSPFVLEVFDKAYPYPVTAGFYIKQDLYDSNGGHWFQILNQSGVYRAWENTLVNALAFKGDLENRGVTALTSVRETGFYRCPTNYISNITDLPSDFVSGSFGLKVFARMLKNGTINYVKQELYDAYGRYWTRLVNYSSGAVLVDWTKYTTDAEVYPAIEENSNKISLLDIMNAEPLIFTVSDLSKYIAYDTGSINSASTVVCSDFIDVSGYDYLVYTRLILALASHSAGMAFYDSSEAYISGEQIGLNGSAVSYTESIIKVPATAKYARFTIYKNGVDGFYVKGIKSNVLKGLKLSVLSDSMSAYTGWIPSGNAAYYLTSNTDKTGVKSVHEMWWKRLCDNTGMEPLVIDAWSGSCICYNCATDGTHDDNLRTPMCSDLRAGRLSDNGADPDIIIISGGTNDWTYSNQSTTPLGSWDGRTAVSRADVLAGQSTFMESYASLIDKLHENYPKAIVVCASLYYVSRGTDLGITRVNDMGYTIPDYNAAIEKVCKIMGVPFIDIYNIGFTYDNYYPTYSQDSDTVPAHANSTGQGVIAKRYIEELPRLVRQIKG